MLVDEQMLRAVQQTVRNSCDSFGLLEQLEISRCSKATLTEHLICCLKQSGKYRGPRSIKPFQHQSYKQHIPEMASSGMDASAGFVARNDTSLLQSSYSSFAGPLPAAGAPHSPLARSSWTPPLAKSQLARCSAKTGTPFLTVPACNTP
ncbi:hypothetical protein SRHO_G00245570 [Serrasalmus rhombeus]